MFIISDDAHGVRFRGFSNARHCHRLLANFQRHDATVKEKTPKVCYKLFEPPNARIQGKPFPKKNPNCS